ncbi:MAG TPA: serine hydrolase domain-containing protein [Opitutaceae bacterium]|nr:serine hydrolase domain-containing protein [Opitutaceae bacterium]
MKNPRGLVLPLVGLLASAHCVLRADTRDDAIVALMQKRNVPGLSLAVVAEGRIVRARGYGVIESGGSTPVTEHTLFQAGSVSKPVAAFGALRPVDSGRLSLDANVNAALKSWKVPENEFTATEKVTLRRLLSHTAGLTVHGFPGYAVGATQPNLVQVLSGEKPANTPAVRADIVPGSKWRYSGGGYTAMQQLVIDVSGRPYPEFMHDTVLEPLGMLAGTFEQPLSQADAAKTATDHFQRAPVKGRWPVYPEMAAAGLWTTASDLARFELAPTSPMGKSVASIFNPNRPTRPARWLDYILCTLPFFSPGRLGCFRFFCSHRSPPRPRLPQYVRRWFFPRSAWKCRCRASNKSASSTACATSG